ncbi:hypothetical protein Fcan01_18941 [Folsomia candida]|uniref:Uncharacterized protein n=1 Tax=Folsomia candida TaxID=158441 RepID=A0A226DJY9_FOLCA|nr:hypothetical protein Fcan01_18941 [Folsomia candida]
MEIKYFLVLLLISSYQKLIKTTTLNLFNAKISHCPIHISVGYFYVTKGKHYIIDYFLSLLSFQEVVQKYQQPFQIDLNRRMNTGRGFIFQKNKGICYIGIIIGIDYTLTPLLRRPTFCVYLIPDALYHQLRAHTIDPPEPGQIQFSHQVLNVYQVYIIKILLNIFEHAVRVEQIYTFSSHPTRWILTKEETFNLLTSFFPVKQNLQGSLCYAAYQGSSEIPSLSLYKDGALWELPYHNLPHETAYFVLSDELNCTPIFLQRSSKSYWEEAPALTHSLRLICQS